MSTNIEWARNPDGSKGETWPVVTGCSHAGSQGCDSCYAARMAATRLKHHPRYEGLATIKNGKARWTGEVRLNHDVLEQPLRWRKPRRVFIASMSDFFHPAIPLTFQVQVFSVIKRCPQHTFQILTKRADQMAMMEYACGLPELPNLWLGVSVENQAAANSRREYLEQCSAAVKFVSYEPAIGPVDWTGWEFVSQIISGGESGPGARPSHPDWHRATRDFCRANDIAYFFKAWGAWAPCYEAGEGWLCLTHQDGNEITTRIPNTSPLIENQWDETLMARVGKKRAGHLLDGRTWQQFPVADGAGTVAIETRGK